MKLNRDGFIMLFVPSLITFLSTYITFPTNYLFAIISSVSIFSLIFISYNFDYIWMLLKEIPLGSNFVEKKFPGFSVYRNKMILIETKDPYKKYLGFFVYSLNYDIAVRTTSYELLLSRLQKLLTDPRTQKLDLHLALTEQQPLIISAVLLQKLPFKHRKLMEKINKHLKRLTVEEEVNIPSYMLQEEIISRSSYGLDILLIGFKGETKEGIYKKLKGFNDIINQELKSNGIQVTLLSNMRLVYVFISFLYGILVPNEFEDIKLSDLG